MNENFNIIHICTFESRIYSLCSWNDDGQTLTFKLHLKHFIKVNNKNI